MANVIVQEVLAFVRPIRLQVEDIAVADVIRDAITMAESHASLKGEVEVKVDMPEALRPMQGDPHQLRQIFTNLLTNAFEAMGGAGAGRDHRHLHRGRRGPGRGRTRRPVR